MYAIRSYYEVLAVDGFRENSGTGCFAYTPGTGEQKRLGNVVPADGVFEGRGDT